jgi:serine/threonine protein phosphatase 1
MTGRVLAIGDVHGCHRALVTLLGLVDVTSADTVVFVGEVVDRGPSTMQAIDCLSHPMLTISAES